MHTSLLTDGCRWGVFSAEAFCSFIFVNTRLKSGVRLPFPVLRWFLLGDCKLFSAFRQITQRPDVQQAGAAPCSSRKRRSGRWLPQLELAPLLLLTGCMPLNFLWEMKSGAFVLCNYYFWGLCFCTSSKSLRIVWVGWRVGLCLVSLFLLNSIRVSSGRTAGGLAPRLLAVTELFTRLWLKRSRTEH